jgi:TolB-like protein/predicted Zn-dependent protease
MSEQDKAKQRLEIAHVLFIDIVGYSRLLTDEQSEALHELNQIVRSTEAAREADAAGRLTILPTGDGMALVFTGSVEEPVECALEISHALRAQPSLPVRMGIHSGPIHHVKDANGRENIAGVGINIAQRVMDCGDAGHILVSKRVADDLAQQRRWQPYIHELGDVEVKHGVVVSLVNLYAETIGNPTPPSRLGKVRRSVRALSKGARKGLSQFSRAIFIIVALVITLTFVLAIVSVIFAPAIMRTLEKRQVTSQPQAPAIPSPPSIGDTIKNALAKQITDELQRDFSRKKKAAAEPASTGSAIPEKSIAVLPFENLSEDKSNAYFADGIQNEILTRLASVRDLKVISRTSTAKYQSKPDNLKTVAQELGVSTLLEGAVQKAGDKVRVNVQLIDAHADAHVWAKSYDREVKDVLSVESEVAEEIAEALKANLSPNESHALAAVRTPDTEAYDLFLRGEYELRQAENSRVAEAYDRADAFYRQALPRDPNFAEAAAELARSRLSRHWFVSPLTETELQEVKSLIDRALALAPNSPEAHSALGLFFYWGYRQYEAALTEFNRTLELQPNNAWARQYCAAVYRRRGEWERSLAEFQRAQELDPRDAGNPDNIGATYLILRLWKDAERAELRALAIDPHNTPAAQDLLIIRLNATGDVDSARRAFDGFPEAIKSLTREWFGAGGDVAGISGMLVYLDVIERRLTDALQAIEKKVVSNDLGHLQQLAGRAALRVLARQAEAAKSAGEEALPLLEAKLRERPDDTFVMMELAWVYLALGRNADALRLARQAANSIPIEKDAVAGPSFQIGLAQIEARAGAPEEAVKRLRHLLAIPAGQVASIARLKIDPVWDPIRDRPDFQQLLAGTELIGPNK